MLRLLWLLSGVVWVFQPPQRLMCMGWLLSLVRRWCVVIVAVLRNNLGQPVSDFQVDTAALVQWRVMTDPATIVSFDTKTFEVRFRCCTARCRFCHRPD
jgi:hypothetical protein